MSLSLPLITYLYFNLSIYLYSLNAFIILYYVRLILSYCDPSYRSHATFAYYNYHSNITSISSFPNIINYSTNSLAYRTRNLHSLSLSNDSNHIILPSIVRGFAVVNFLLGCHVSQGRELLGVVYPINDNRAWRLRDL